MEFFVGNVKLFWYTISQTVEIQLPLITATVLLITNFMLPTIASFFAVKSFITFYLIQYHKNAFHEELFLSVCSILQMELYFSGLVRNDTQTTALGCLKILAYKKRRVPRTKTNS